MYHRFSVFILPFGSTQKYLTYNALYFFFRYRQTRFSSRRIRKRVIFKHGDCNVVQGNVAKRRRRYMQVNILLLFLF